MNEASTVISLEPSPAAAQGLSIRAQADQLTITDKQSHGIVREALKGAKELKRQVAEHYAKIKRPINDARATILTMEKDHLFPIDQAIAILERKDIDWINAERRRVEEAERIEREKAETLAREQKAREAAAFEAQAQAMEESSNVLSDRERRFVFGILQGQGPAQSASIAGYANPAQQSERLMKSEKIKTALFQAEEAARIRREAQDHARAPLSVLVAPVESHVASVAGTKIKTYTSCDPDVDLKALVRAWLDGTLPVRGELPFMVNLPFLNKEARDLGDLFEANYPGCKKSTRQGVSL